MHLLRISADNSTNW